MKNIICKYILVALAFMSVGLCSCSDDYMSDLNTDPSKATDIDPNAQLTYVQLYTYGSLDFIGVHRTYLYAFTQHLMGCWNTTNYGGRHTITDDSMGSVFRRTYSQPMKELVDAISRTDGDPAKVNVNAALRIYRAYYISLVTDLYGDVPCSEAGLGYIEGNFTPRYDTQEEIYDWLFKELSEAVAAMGTGEDAISGDVIYKGDVNKWKKFANSLRLRYAMRISDVKPELAKAEFEAALNADGGVISSSDEDAMIPYMEISYSFGGDAYNDYRGNALAKLFFGNDPTSNPTYMCSTFFNYMKDNDDPRTYRICRCYYDGLMSLTNPEGRIDLTDEIIAKGVKMSPRDPGAYWWEPWPTGYESDIMKEVKKSYPDVTTYMESQTEPKLATNFLGNGTPGTVITYAEVCFLKAEAAINGWNVGGSSSEFYNEGVREAMNFICDKYGSETITNAEIVAYLAEHPVGNTQEEKKKNINTQAWVLHFHNPFEAYANVRRSGYPELKSPAEYGFRAFLTGGEEIPVRLCYPVLESSYNKTNYDEALARMGGEDSWHTHVWWDVK
ncbi:SusD/RagB family nutrient-binding outer membrane lipoprotein [uncultured Bacteroides sp.]|jgi:putative lipoprotein|uniref:SusD/RagB family nutrient-binding outer membrane lipoprotein n=1 Tax=uncultured Bacteroides sp. TaxID=162156 RepID=UPI0035A66D9B